MSAAALATFAGLGDLFESTLQTGAATRVAAQTGDDSQPQPFADSSVDDVLPAEAPPVLAALAEATSCAFPTAPGPVPRRLRLAGPDFERGPPPFLS